MKKITIFILFFHFFAAQAVLAREDEIKRSAKEARDVLASTEAALAAKSGEPVFDYGAWINYRFFKYHDEDNDDSVQDLTQKLHWIDSRAWLKITRKPPLDAPYENEHYLYIRIKDLMTASLPKNTAGGWDHDGPHLEYAYASLDGRPFWLKLGRKYFSVGQGIAYGDDNDGAELFYLASKWRIKGFVSRTVPSQENIDTSVPGYDKASDRYFYGLEYIFQGIAGHALYGYAVAQKDFSDPSPLDPAHDYRYDSQYYGLGAEGSFFSLISYNAELIKEYGKSRIFDTDEKKDVDAWAGKANISFAPAVYSSPDFSFEYAFGSGDSSRQSVTDTISGNTSGKDTNFLYFGYFPTSYALFPRLSNLHQFRMGVAAMPFERNNLLQRLLFKINFYKFYKDRASGAIDDPEASQADRDIGNEIDATISWRVFSDLGVSLQYGHFIPGKAYPDSTNDHEDFFSLSTTFIF